MTVKKRRSLTPTAGESNSGSANNAAADGLHATRRGGARRELSARVTLKGASGQVLEGWALNVSRGGIRIILEEKVDLGGEFEVTFSGSPVASGGGTDARDARDEENASSSPPHNVGRIVWVQEEPDGVVAGIEFIG